MEKLIITRVADCFFAKDARGHKIEICQRRSACFIITVKGKIRFTLHGRTLICDKEHPLFLPQGASYVNECLESAESYVFNFLTADEHPPTSLSAPHELHVKRAFEHISTGNASSLRDEMQALGELYFLYSEMIAPPSSAASEHLLHTACSYVYQHYSEPSLTVKSIAEYCFVSESYLRKLFLEKLGTSPFRYVSAVRMQKAQTLLYEKRPIGEIAHCVGYSDVYQFSRASKRDWGKTPSAEAQ